MEIANDIKLPMEMSSTSSSSSTMVYNGGNCLVVPTVDVAEAVLDTCSNGQVPKLEPSDTSCGTTLVHQGGLDPMFNGDLMGKEGQQVSLVHGSSTTLIKGENPSEYTFLCNHCGEKFSDLSSFAQHVCILTGDRALSPCTLSLEDPYESIQTPPADSLVVSLKSEPMVYSSHPPCLPSLVSMPNGTALIAIAAPNFAPSLVAQSVASSEVVPAPVTDGEETASVAISPTTTITIKTPKLTPAPSRKAITSLAPRRSPKPVSVRSGASSSSTTHADGTRSFVCALCGKSYTSANGLIIHERRHAGERPYPCRFCSKSFPDSSSCSRHERIHTGERPYVCEFCGRAFNDSSHLVTHRRKHTGERPYPCTQCDKAFFKSSDLKRHSRTHLSERHHPCDKCEKTFKEASALARHERIHTNDRPFVCDMCNKSFFDRSSYLRHVRIHTAERSWTCEVCGKGFYDAANLKRHTRTHFGEPVLS